MQRLRRVLIFSGVARRDVNLRAAHERDPAPVGGHARVQDGRVARGASHATGRGDARRRPKLRLRRFRAWRFRVWALIVAARREDLLDVHDVRPLRSRHEQPRGVLRLARPLVPRHAHATLALPQDVRRGGAAGAVGAGRVEARVPRARRDVQNQQRPRRPRRSWVVGEVRVKVRDVLVVGAELEPAGVQRSGRGADHIIQRQRADVRSGVARGRSGRPVATPPRAFLRVFLVRVGLSALARAGTHRPGRARAPLRRPQRLTSQ